jgi:phosphate-selective porin OprO/OprP
MLDAGEITADETLQQAFPGLEGSKFSLRRLSVSFAGYLFSRALEFKTEVDFAQVEDIKDNWIRFPKIPILKYMTIGHVKEPFSLEGFASSNYTTFMEKALPNEAFAPSRNIGILGNNVIANRRMTWAIGWFLNTGSFSSFGEARDQIDQATGVNLTARVTGLPWKTPEEGTFLHLGLSYSYRWRDLERVDTTTQFRSRPESRLTDTRFVDTGEFIVDNYQLLTPELALVHGPFALQGEYFQTFTDIEGKIRFWGYYFYGSVFLTGEQRGYSPSQGIFSKVTPKRGFAPLKGAWGAWEAGLRYSYVDLNDGPIKGGREGNFTAGLNWYLNWNIRLMLNYIHASVHDREDPLIDDGDANIFQTRFQIHF